MEALEDRAERIRLIRDSAGAIAPPDDLKRVRALRYREPGFDRAVWRRMCELGWLDLRVAEAAGGSGLGMREYCALAEECDAGLLPEPLIPCSIAARVLAGGELVYLAEIVDRSAGDADRVERLHPLARAAGLEALRQHRDQRGLVLHALAIGDEARVLGELGQLHHLAQPHELLVGADREHERHVGAVERLPRADGLRRHPRPHQHFSRDQIVHGDMRDRVYLRVEQRKVSMRWPWPDARSR